MRVITHVCVQRTDTQTSVKYIQFVKFHNSDYYLAHGFMGLSVKMNFYFENIDKNV